MLNLDAVCKNRRGRFGAYADLGEYLAVTKKSYSTGRQESFKLKKKKKPKYQSDLTFKITVG